MGTGKAITLRGSLATAAGSNDRRAGSNATSGGIRLAVGKASFVGSTQHKTLEEAQAAALTHLSQSLGVGRPERPPDWAGVHETMFGFVWRDDDHLPLTCGSPLVSVWDGERWRPARKCDRGAVQQ